jgi:hypothetical protein
MSIFKSNCEDKWKGKYYSHPVDTCCKSTEEDGNQLTFSLGGNYWYTYYCNEQYDTNPFACKTKSREKQAIAPGCCAFAKVITPDITDCYNVPKSATAESTPTLTSDAPQSAAAESAPTLPSGAPDIVTTAGAQQVEVGVDSYEGLLSGGLPADDYAVAGASDILLLVVLSSPTWSFNSIFAQ